MSRIYPSELQLNKANAFDTETSFEDLHLSFSNGVMFVYIWFSYSVYSLPYNRIKDKLICLIERNFQREGSLYIKCNDSHAFFIFDTVRIIIYGLVRKCVKFHLCLRQYYIRFGSNLYQ